jgi:Tfp pilus assembly protein PilZ
MRFTAKKALMRALRESERAPSDGGMRGLQPLPLDLALLELDRATGRDALLQALLRGAAFWLREVQIYLARGGLLRGYIAGGRGSLDRRAIRCRALDIQASPAVENALRRDRSAMVVVREDDPVGHLSSHRQLVLQPVCLDARPVCLVLGPPRDHRPGRREQLLWAMDRLADGAAEGIHRLILERRASPKPRRSRELEIVALPPPDSSARAPAPAARTDRVAQVIPMHRPARTPFRFPRPVEIGPLSLDNFYTGLDGSIHHAGIFVATHAPRRVGDRVEVTFTIPELLGAQTIIGPVHWIQEYDPDRHSEHSVPGMGVKLRAADLSAGVRAAIERFIRQRPPLLYE